MSRTSAVVIVLVFWSAIYLPSLGTLEIKGEEGRRILPAVTMLQTGNYIVPQVGSEPYLRKPPLVNWLVAASFRLFGARNEWTARLPSALCVLSVALAFVIVARSSLGRNGSLVAALAWLTNFGMIEKGRLIEIEALYASLAGLAFICWLSFYHEQRSRWLTWTVPWIFLGLGWLAKGPLHLVFFYAVVIAVLYRHRELRRIFNPAHLIGVLLMLGIFAAWAMPCLLMVRETNVAHTWSRQFSGRVTGEDFHFSSWVMNIPRGLAYLLPWLLFFPFAGRVEFVDERERRSASGLRWAMVLSFVGVELLPGALPRYAMPLLAPACWLLAVVLCAERTDLPRLPSIAWPKQISPRMRLPLLVAAVVTFGVLVYSIAIVPQLAHRQKIRMIAEKIDAVIAPRDSLYAVDPDYQPFLFYVRTPLHYVSTVADVPPDARFVLVQPENKAAVENSRQWLPRHARLVLPIKDYRQKETTVYRIE